MPMIIDPGAGNTGSGGDGDLTKVGNLIVSGVPNDRLIAAVVLVMRDEINLIRADPLTILGARSVTDIVNAVKAKL